MKVRICKAARIPACLSYVGGVYVKTLASTIANLGHEGCCGHALSDRWIFGVPCLVVACFLYRNLQRLCKCLTANNVLNHKVQD